MFRFNENTAEQTYFTNTSCAAEYDFLGLSQHNVSDKKSRDYHNYIDQIPIVFHPYVENIKNVLGDGNCGFRATASALGYGEDQWLLIRRLLIDEMVQFETHYKKALKGENNAVGSYNDVFSSLQWSGPGFAPREYWMLMPETGFLIANKFNVIFHFISKEGNNSSTFFPLWRGPDQFPDKKIITIALVDSNHYIMVEMQGEFPMGFTNNLWRLRRERSAAEWKNLFKSRQKLYKDWIAKPAEYEVID